jgi:hypothetical protein
MRFFPFLTIVITMCATVAARAEHIHDLHPASPHGPTYSCGGRFVRISLEDGTGFQSSVNLVSDTWEVIFEQNFVNGNTEPATATVTQVKKVGHAVAVTGEVSVGGSVEAEAGQFFAKLKATAQASITVTTGWTGTGEEEVNISDSTVNPPGGILNFKAKKKKKTANGMVSCYDHKIVCKCNGNNNTCPQPPTTFYCNQVTLSGNGVGWGIGENVWTQMGPMPPPGGGGTPPPGGP